MYIKYFNEISKNDVNLVGGKGASLGEMANAEIPVPSGFVITTEVFDNKLVSIGSSLSQIVIEEILKNFDNLHVERVAVRSSAVAEDSSQASWAGQLETFLNVSREDLIINIKKCWDSIKSERALSYASGKNLSKDQLIVAVIVQKMVDSQSAGVMFTVNPVTKDKNEVVVESINGLGEALVQGLVTPDNFIVDKANEKIKVRNLQKEGEQTISDKKIKELVRLGKTIEYHYGSPQDIEWAIDEQGKVWILQSRPITTL